MPTLDTLIKINISQQTSAVPQASFSLPLIVGPTSTSWAGLGVHSYTDPAEMLTDGFSTGSPEYVYALELFEQAVSPAEFFVGYRAPAVAQQDTFVVNSLTGVPGHVYKFSFNGILVSYTSQGGDSYAQIIAGLNTAFAAAVASSVATSATSGSGAGSTLTVTSAVLGLAFSITAVDSELTHATPVVNHGIQDDINALIVLNNLWYCLILCSNTDADILQASALIETLTKIFGAVSNDAAIATSSSTDLLSVLQGKAYKRTFLTYSPGSFNLGIEAGWIGSQLPLTPGSNNWAYKSIAGISPDTISDTARSIIIGVPEAGVLGKNGNIYSVVGGVPITQMGIMVGGQYIDITIGLDWLKSQIQTNVFAALTQAAKIPYTDIGTSVLISAVKSAIDQGAANGLIDDKSPITVTAPPVLSVPANQRANRIAPTISFTCRLQGAFNAVIVNGTVTV